ncbi:phytoene desaturase family protein [Aeromicrobium terrae]|uniref:NAD(P)/FAD-dependent oxidoreductase n=1 Tax=Aeromicrobium terrae TaxID=2498846 RepID=A0A5C8NI60_9ACTN|nr:NAD(P)/FAD-dependent oxidoreductase [Aeromicrobium terrae]TXL60707.1 NAD(P)/FAD-dependent oxidoreductase [Aeromicrobium terrae]
MTSAVIVGSGPNGLAAAVTLAAEGVDVTVLESADTPGGGVRSGEATLPGLVHDECSGFHPFAVESVFSRRFDLAEAGLRWAWPDVQYAHPLDGGRGAAAVRSVEETAASLGADARSYRRMYGPLTERFDRIADEFLQPLAHVPSHPIALARFGLYAPLPAGLLARRFRTEEARALWGGVAAHNFRPMSGLLSSAIGAALATAAHRFGWPVAVGGSAAIADAMITLLEKSGGRVETGIHVSSIDELPRADIVMLDTSPRSAARILGDRLGRRTSKAYRRFQHGTAAFQVALAVEDGIPWSYEPARRAGTVHLSGTFAETAAAERATAGGEMPDRPFVLLGQQYLADPSRSQGSLHPVDAYAHVPSGYTGDATELVLRQIERFAPGVRDHVRAMRVRTTAQIARDNPNYVGGDIITGEKTPVQTLVGPRLALNPYGTGVPGVFLCSAAAPPGPGAHGLVGHHAARTALRRLR